MTLAQELIAENKRTRNTFLDLGRCGLTELPEELFDCVWLENLNLGAWYFDEREQKWKKSENKGEKNQLKRLDNKATLLSNLNPFKTAKNIATLKNLRILSFRENKVVDIACLQGLSNLTKLDFSHNQVVDIACLQGLSNLTYLDFGSNQVVDISCLQGLSNLTKLDFRSNQVVDISCLQGLSNLTKLDFRSNQVVDISCLQGLSNLTNLYFGGNQVVDISCLQGLSNLTNLYFGGNQVVDISCLQGLSNLTHLYFAYNQVVDISCLQGLSNLTKLDFHFNQVVDISCLQGLSNLTYLDFNNNQVVDIAYLQGLSNLTELKFSFNRVVDISCLQGLSNLTKLDFGSNQVVDISCLQGLSNLTKLYFWNNQVVDISCLQGLSNLTELYFFGNQVVDISCLQGLSNLRDLNFSSNQVVDISCLQGLSNLKLLKFKYTPAFDKLSKELKDKHNSWDNQIEVLQYWLDNFGNKTQQQYFREAKVVLVGEGKVGKTSLLHLLLYGQKIEASRTEKIAIHTNKDLFTYQQEKLTTYFWDFGGQEIMHATHKFFMTDKTVYVLVVSGREDNTDNLDKWLELLQSSVGNSPIILAVNQLDEEKDKHRLPYHSLKDKYPQIVGLVETSWLTGRGIAELQKQIQAALQTLPHFTEPFARKYFAVKEKLQATNKDYIHYTAYEGICQEIATEQNTDFNETSQSILADLLNSLGIMLNFRSKHESLQELCIFNPEWIINGVYQIINSEAVQRTQGSISENEINKLLGNIGYKLQAERDFIIRMMQHFKLAYRKVLVNHELQYLIPSIFPPDKPQPMQTYWQTKPAGLHFRFQYQVWRNDYVAYFLVFQHDKIKENLFWKNGAVLQYQHHEVQIEANRYTKTIEIQVVGDTDKRYALWQVREALEQVHDLFVKENLKITEWIVRQENGKEDVFEVQELKDLLEMGDTQITSTKLKKRFQITELLEGVELSNSEKLNAVLQEKKLSKEQIKELVDLVHRQQIADFFELLKDCGIAHYQASSFEKQFIGGDFDKSVFWDRLITYVRTL